MEIIDSVAFIVKRDDKFLVEKRKITKILDPGKTVIPGGHIEKGETPKEAALRELLEELDLKSKQANHLCTLYEKRKEFEIRIYYFVIGSFYGEEKALEADSIHWKKIADFESSLDLEVDKVAIREFKRLYENTYNILS